MHMADALVSPTIAGVMYVCAAGATAYALKKENLKVDTEKIPLMGVMGAFVFATQMINFTIPGTGASGHLCGGMLLSAILGPAGGFLTMVGILLVQCLLFADGGLLALGCNIWNMAFYGCFIGGMIIWELMMRNGISKKKIILVSITSCVLTLQMGAFSVCLETLASGITELPFVVFVMTMQPIHLIIGLVEGIITSAVLVFIYEARPELLWQYKTVGFSKNGKMTYKNTVAVLLIAAVITGGLLSLVASSNPDGLEWSLERLTGATELAAEGSFYVAAEEIQNKTAILPDYAFKNSDHVLGTSFSGIIGGAIIILFCALGSRLFFRAKDFNTKFEKN